MFILIFVRRLCKVKSFIGCEALKYEGYYNKSLKVMYDLPYATHRYFIEHLTNQPHLKKVLIQRYLKFILSVEKSPKSSLHILLNIAKNDVRSVTGANLRHIMLLCDKNSVNDLTPDDALNIKYHEPPKDEIWRLGVLEELLEVQYGDLNVPGFNDEELAMMRSYICTT